MKRMFSMALAAVCLCFAVQALADDTFKDGDTVCFYGDSITHGHEYHSLIYNYYLTRFPDRNIRFVNAGISGDSAGGALGRMKDDVTSKNPTVVVVMFGMNDVNRGSYVAKPTPQQLKQQAGALKWYHDNMDKLLTRLSTETSARLILLTPSPFDETCVNDRNNNQPGCNEGLGKCADIVRAAAPKFKAKVVDLHDPMTALNVKLQKNDPKYTLIGPDRVHPARPGNFMMAWLFLKAQDAPALVSDVAIDAAAGKAEAKNATVTNVVKNGADVTFTVLEKSLPCPVEPAAKPILSEIPFEKDLNEETLRVTGLAAGDYELKIDGVAVAKHSATDWAAGVNLALCDKTPQMQQALKVAQKNEQRRLTECRLRNYGAVRWFLGHQHVNPDDFAAIQKFADTKMNKKGYFEQQVPTYMKEWPNRGQVQAKVDALDKETRDLCKPVAHKYELRASR